MGRNPSYYKRLSIMTLKNEMELYPILILQGFKQYNKLYKYIISYHSKYFYYLMLNFVNNTFLNSIQYSRKNDDNNRMKGGVPMNEYGDTEQDSTGIIYGGYDGVIQEELNMEGGSFFVPIGLAYYPPPLCDYENNKNKNHEFSENVPVISDKRFDSLFSLVSSQKKLSSSRKKNRRIPFTKTKKIT